MPPIPAGLTITPGGAAFQFELSYCDNDGNYANDTAVLQIFSNDPDENPALVTGNVMLPDQCPNR